MSPRGSKLWVKKFSQESGARHGRKPRNRICHRSKTGPHGRESCDLCARRQESWRTLPLACATKAWRCSPRRRMLRARRTSRARLQNREIARSDRDSRQQCRRRLLRPRSGSGRKELGLSVRHQFEIRVPAFEGRRARNDRAPRAATSSTSARWPERMLSKAALFIAPRNGACMGLTECMAEDLREYGIRVSVICPGSWPPNLARPSARRIRRRCCNQTTSPTRWKCSSPRRRKASSAKF